MGTPETHTEMLHGEDGAPMMEDAPKLGLRIFSTPCSEGDGGALCARFLSGGMEVIATELEKVKGWDALRARYERSAKERAGVLYTKGPSATQTNAPPKMQWPEGYRFSTPKRFWRAKIISQDGQGGFQEHNCMLVVANAAEERTQENVEMDLKDSADVASYASRFNQHLNKLFGEQGGVPGVKVCAPVGCEVIKSSNTKFANPGEAITVIPYPFPDVKKFLFDGSEDFLEIPQAFFHHSAWLSNMQEMVCDLQGIEDDDGNIVLIDPCIIRAPKPTVGNLLSTAFASSHAQKENMPQKCADISSSRFDALHPRCSQLCKSFDPCRRSAAGRTHCGLNIGCY
jgi:hypothetical protein